MSADLQAYSVGWYIDRGWEGPGPSVTCGTVTSFSMVTDTDIPPVGLVLYGLELYEVMSERGGKIARTKNEFQSK